MISTFFTNRKCRTLKSTKVFTHSSSTSARVLSLCFFFNSSTISSPSPGKTFVSKTKPGIPESEQVVLEPELEEALKNATDAEMCDIAGETNATVQHRWLYKHNSLPSLMLSASPALYLLRTTSQNTCSSANLIQLGTLRRQRRSDAPQ